VSSATGVGMSELVAAVAGTAMGLSHVNQTIPKAYVDLGSSLQNWGRALVMSGKPPVCSRDAILERTRESTELSQSLAAPGIALRALEFLSSGGVVVLAHDEDSVVLDPMWLADTLACVVTVDPCRRATLPKDLLLQGQLPHDDSSLAAVWPSSMGYTSELRNTLLALLRRFGLAFEMRNKDDMSLGRSVIPSMLPSDTLWGGVSTNDLLGPLAPGDIEAAVDYHLPCAPPDLWAMLLVRLAALSVPTACTSSMAVLQFDSQRACLSLDLTCNKLSVLCRGTTPTELRSRVHSLLVGLVNDKFFGLLADDAVSVSCTACKRSNVITPYSQLKAAQGKTVKCRYCSGRAPLDLMDIVEPPEMTLVKLLDRVEEEDFVDVSPAFLSALAARVCDTVFGLASNKHPRLWLPTTHWGGGSWLWICEDPSGWHMGGEFKVSGSHVLEVPEALLPLLLGLARTLRAAASPTDDSRRVIFMCITYISELARRASSDSHSSVPTPAMPHAAVGSRVVGSSTAPLFPWRLNFVDIRPSDVTRYATLAAELFGLLSGSIGAAWCADPTLVGRHGRWVCRRHEGPVASLTPSGSAETGRLPQCACVDPISDV
jgi:hypothetical protein